MRICSDAFGRSSVSIKPNVRFSDFLVQLLLSMWSDLSPGGRWEVHFPPQITKSWPSRVPSSFLRENTSTRPSSWTLSWYSRGRIERQHQCSQGWLYIVLGCQANWEFMSFPHWPEHFVDVLLFLFMCFKWSQSINKFNLYMLLKDKYSCDQNIMSIKTSGDSA